MKFLVYLFSICPVLLSCSEPRGHREVLSRALSMMNEHPDSALRILDSLGEHEQQFGSGFLMRYRLHRTNALNKLDTVFCSTTEVQQLADYFDSYGTANEQMLAHYLLGRAYYDTGESPMALKCFQDAAAKADTTAKDCDYRQLSFVYGQMGTLFWRQNLIKNGIECSDMAIKYAWMGKDTLNALLNMADKIELYENMNMNDSALYFCYTVNNLLKKYGYKQSAASVLGISIDMLIDKGEISKAKHNIDIYEAETGYFDSLGNIQKGREVYYSLKGEYYMAVNKYDSAEYYFRKELRDGKDFNNQNVGARDLALLFQRTNRPDSAAKYALYSYDMNDSVYANMATKEVERNYNMYNYIRHQEIAQQEKEKAEYEHKKVLCLYSCLFVLVLSAIIYYKRLKKKRAKEHLKYLQTVATLKQVQTDVDKLKSYKAYFEQMQKVELDVDLLHNNIDELQKMIVKKENKIASLQLEIQTKYQTEHPKNSSIDNKLISHENYLLLCDLSTKGKVPTDEQWTKLTNIVIDVFPQYYEYLASIKLGLNKKEYNTCLLLRLSVKPKSIASMLEVTPAYISKIRSEMHAKLFGVDGSPKEFDRKLLRIT